MYTKDKSETVNVQGTLRYGSISGKNLSIKNIAIIFAGIFFLLFNLALIGFGVSVGSPVAWGTGIGLIALEGIAVLAVIFPQQRQSFFELIKENPLTALLITLAVASVIMANIFTGIPQTIAAACTILLCLGAVASFLWSLNSSNKEEKFIDQPITSTHGNDSALSIFNNKKEEYTFEDPDLNYGTESTVVSALDELEKDLETSPLEDDLKKIGASLSNNQNNAMASCSETFDAIGEYIRSCKDANIEEKSTSELQAMQKNITAIKLLIEKCRRITKNLGTIDNKILCRRDRIGYKVFNRYEESKNKHEETTSALRTADYFHSFETILEDSKKLLIEVNKELTEKSRNAQDEMVEKTDHTEQQISPNTL